MNVIRLWPGVKGWSTLSTKAERRDSLHHKSNSDSVTLNSVSSYCDDGTNKLQMMEVKLLDCQTRNIVGGKKMYSKTPLRHSEKFSFFSRQH